MGKKHKKKVFTKPKKCKHENVKTSMNDFIKSLNNCKCNTCNSILAIHDNRNYCGKCQISIKI